MKSKKLPPAASHTPTPLVLESERIMLDGKCIAWTGFGPGRVSMKWTTEEMANHRAFIVKAVNAHEALVDFVETVAMGNTEMDALESKAASLRAALK